MMTESLPAEARPEQPRCWPVPLLATCLIALAAGVSAPAQAQSDATNPALEDRFTIFAGGFFPQLDSGVRLSSDLGDTGDLIDFEDLLGMADSDAVFWGGLQWRISNRNSLEFEWVRLNRSGSVGIVSDSFQIGNSLVQVGAQVDSRFDVKIARLTYGYSIVKNDHWQATLKAGVHAARVEAAVSLSGSVIDVDTGFPIASGSVNREGEDATLPLPHVGASLLWAITPKLSARAQMMGFSLKISDIKGTIFDAGFDLQYRIWKRVGLGAGFRYFDVDVKKRNDIGADDKFDFKYWGPTVYATVSF